MHKNARSLTNDAAVDLLVQELSDVQWDVVALNETWRTEKREYWVTEPGEHIFAAPGHDSPTRGVAFLVHKQHARRIRRFKAVNERIAYIDVDIGKHSLRIITAYFPHGGYGDQHVQTLYDVLTEIHTDAQQQKLTTVLTGDFNAQVGRKCDDGDDGNANDVDRHTLGRYGLDMCNQRGIWLRSWACVRKLIIANTIFCKHPHNIFTYAHTGARHTQTQIDYILVDREARHLVLDAFATTCPDLGSDHQAVHLRLALDGPTCQPRRRRKRRPRRNHIHQPLQPNDPDYQHHLKKHLTCNDPTSSTQDACTRTEEALRAAYKDHQQQREDQHMHEPQQQQYAACVDDEARRHLQALITQRRNTPHSDTATRTTLSKRILRQHRAIKRAQRQAALNEIITNFRGLNKISGIKSSKKKDLIPAMTTADGVHETDRHGIADVFADFYEKLYRCPPEAHSPAQESATSHTNNNTTTHMLQSIPPFTDDELHQAVKQLRNGRCKDTAGLTAELLKAGGRTIEQHLLKLFNDILAPEQTPPEQWRRTTISVIHKSGDPQLPNNYRPIAIIPLLYKLMARLLCNRLEAHFDSQQSPDQAGFRNGFCTEDHLFTTTMLFEQSNEWQMNLWTAAVDFKKAFDCVYHHCLWEALRDQGVPAPYITLLQKFYNEQTATVRTDVNSRAFSIERGVKQGDPLSSYLFNALLEHVFRKLKPAWTRKGLGVKL